MSFLRYLVQIIILLALPISTMPLHAADAFPNHPITLVVPYPAGGVVDVRTREIGQVLSRELGVNVIVDNRPGGLGGIGAAHVAKAKPDGYTLLVGSINELVVVPAYGVELQFDPNKDLAPITTYLHGGMLLVVPSALGVTTVQQLVALAKARPGQLHYGTVGVGSILHLAGELLERSARIDLVDIPYKGGAQALPELLASRTQLQFDLAATSMPHIKAGTLRALMVTTSNRIPLLPDVPTAREAGYPALEIVTWGGFLAPAGTSQEVIAKLNGAFRKALADPKIRQSIEDMGGKVAPCSPEEFASVIRSERDRWDKRIALTGIRIAKP